MNKFKFCQKCKQIKPVEEFGIDNSAKDGLKYFCYECQRKMDAIRRERFRIAEDLKLKNEELNEYYKEVKKSLVKNLNYGELRYEDFKNLH